MAFFEKGDLPFCTRGTIVFDARRSVINVDDECGGALCVYLI